MKVSLKIKILIIVIVDMLIAGAVSIIISYKIYSGTIDNYYKNTITNIAKSAASLMDAEKIGLYADSLDRDEDYDRMLNILFNIKENSDVEYLYVEKVVGKTATAIMDADADNPMEFRQKFDVSQGADTSKLKNGIPAFISDEAGVGWMCSVFTPIRNHNGETVALVGADISMEEVMEQRHHFLLVVCIAISLITAVVAVILLFLITKIVVRPVNKLSEATANFVSQKYKQGMNENEETSLISQLDISSNDEIGNLVKSVKEMEHEIRKYIVDLTAITADRERINVEINLATRIQADMLPGVFPNRDEFDIYATMEPAKGVGGDFYDFFSIDDDHMALVMADVSGKGIPAALFMVIARTLIKTCAQTNKSPKYVLEKVNNQLCENNYEEMFVTVWLGVIELSTGLLRAANAGHEYPVLKKSGEKFEIVKDKHGLVLAGMEMSRYKEYEIQMEEGDILYLYTDGVPEAINKAEEMYGTERMLAALDNNSDGTLKELLCGVRKDIDEFAGDAPQFDDITMLAFRLKKINNTNKGEKSMTIIPNEDSIRRVAEFVESELKEKCVSDRIITKINIAVDEIYSNIVRYSGAHEVTVRCIVTDEIATLIFIDDGIQYNPMDSPEPDITLSAEERDIGGLGIYMVKKTMSDMNYEYKDGKNVLTVVAEMEVKNGDKKESGRN